jgi:Dolichyl-phosphate-mannose-protein mannosyltransferase
MDVDGHLAYVAFIVREGRPPLPGEPSVPADIAALRAHGLASDYVYPGSYRRWAALGPGQREAERLRWLAPNDTAPYVTDNYEAQHPPLYYLLASLVDRPVRHRPYDIQVFCLGVLSAALFASAIPALWFLFSRRFDRRPALALLLTVVWFPNLMPFLGRPTNDALAFPLMCWLLWLIDRPALARRHVIWGGVVLVAGLLTKSYFLVMVPVFLAACLLRGGAGGGRSFGMLALGGAVVAVGAAPLLVANYATTGLLVPVLEARLTAAEPLSRRLAGLLMVDWRLFPLLMVRGFFWSGYWSWVAPGPWYYLPVAAPVLLWLPWPRGANRAAAGGWCRATLADTWVHAAAWTMFLLAMWWHAGQFALAEAIGRRAQFIGGEGWYLNVLAASTAVILAVAVRERYGRRRLEPILVSAAVGAIVWNLVARVALYEFWGGSVRLWSGLRFARFDDLMAALSNPESWRAWRSWPGVVGPAWLTVAAPLALAVACSLFVLRPGDGRRWEPPQAEGA